MKELEQVVKRWQLIDFAQHSKKLWIEEPEHIPRVAHDIPGRTPRLKQLGNSVVPQIPQFLGHCILIYEDEREE